MPASRKRTPPRPKLKKTVLRASTGRKARSKKVVARRAKPLPSSAPAPERIERITRAVFATTAPTSELVAPPAAAGKIVTASNFAWRKLGAFFAFTLVATAIGGFIIHTVNAATFQGPSQAAPGGNIPVTIWNRIAATARQTGASIDIDAGTLTVGIPDIIYGNMAAGSPAASNGIRLQTGSVDRFKVTRDGNMTVTGMSTFGSATLTVAPLASNLLYGNIDGPTSTSGSLLLLQRESVDRFRVDGEGRVSTGSAATVVSGAQNLLYGNMDTSSTGNLLLLQNESVDRFKVTAKGDVKANGCFGSTFVGFTAAVWPGNVGSYYAADNKCATDFVGSHVCKVEQMLESIQCSIPGDPIRVSGGNFGWINGGPPGDSAVNANDCIGWTSNSGGAYGRVWIFDDTTGGRGTLTGCNVGGGGLKFACCR